jgi:hypothetical protein
LSAERASRLQSNAHANDWVYLGQKPKQVVDAAPHFVIDHASAPSLKQLDPIVLEAHFRRYNKSAGIAGFC